MAGLTTCMSAWTRPRTRSHSVCSRSCACTRQCHRRRGHLRNPSVHEGPRYRANVFKGARVFVVVPEAYVQEDDHERQSEKVVGEGRIPAKGNGGFEHRPEALREGVVHVVGIKLMGLKKPYSPGLVTAESWAAAFIVSIVLLAQQGAVGPRTGRWAPRGWWLALPRWRLACGRQRASLRERCRSAWRQGYPNEVKAPPCLRVGATAGPLL